MKNLSSTKFLNAFTMTSSQQLSYQNSFLLPLMRDKEMDCVLVKVC